MAGFDWGGLAGRLGTGVMDFMKTGYGQTLGGAALGAGVSELTGGDWEQGAMLGGLAGMGNALSAEGGFGGDTWTGSALDDALLGGGTPGTKSYLEQANQLGSKRAFTPGEAAGLQSGYENLVASQPTGLAGTFDAVSKGYDKYKDPMDMALKGYKTYSEAQDASRKADLADAQMREQARFNAYNLDQAKAADRRRNQTGTGAREGFAASSMFR